MRSVFNKEDFMQVPNRPNLAAAGGPYQPSELAYPRAGAVPSHEEETGVEGGGAEPIMFSETPAGQQIMAKIQTLSSKVLSEVSNRFMTSTKDIPKSISYRESFVSIIKELPEGTPKDPLLMKALNSLLQGIEITDPKAAEQIAQSTGIKLYELKTPAYEGDHSYHIIVPTDKDETSARRYAGREAAKEAAKQQAVLIGKVQQLETLNRLIETSESLLAERDIPPFEISVEESTKDTGTKLRSQSTHTSYSLEWKQNPKQSAEGENPKRLFLTTTVITTIPNLVKKGSTDVVKVTDQLLLNANESEKQLLLNGRLEEALEKAVSSLSRPEGFVQVADDEENLAAAGSPHQQRVTLEPVETLPSAPPYQIPPSAPPPYEGELSEQQIFSQTPMGQQIMGEIEALASKTLDVINNIRMNLVMQKGLPDTTPYSKEFVRVFKHIPEGVVKDPILMKALNDLLKGIGVINYNERAKPFRYDPKLSKDVPYTVREIAEANGIELKQEYKRPSRDPMGNATPNEYYYSIVPTDEEAAVGMAYTHQQAAEEAVKQQAICMEKAARLGKLNRSITADEKELTTIKKEPFKFIFNDITKDTSSERFPQQSTRTVYSFEWKPDPKKSAERENPSRLFLTTTVLTTTGNPKKKSNTETAVTNTPLLKCDEGTKKNFIDRGLEDIIANAKPLDKPLT